MPLSKYCIERAAEIRELVSSLTAEEHGERATAALVAFEDLMEEMVHLVHEEYERGFKAGCRGASRGEYNVHGGVMRDSGGYDG